MIMAHGLGFGVLASDIKVQGKSIWICYAPGLRELKISEKEEGNETSGI